MKEEIKTERAPAAIGPYVQGTVSGSLIFTSGQLPIDAGNGKMAEGIKAQTLQSLKNIAFILEEAGSERAKILKTTVFLKDMNDFASMNEVYAEFFEGLPYPSRSAVEVARLPKDALVEIEAVAQS